MYSGVAENNHRRITLLLVDGSDKSAEEIMLSLSTMQPEVYPVVARTLAEARSWLDNNTPDLAIVDLNLPDGRGTLLLAPERNNSPFPIVLISDEGYETEAVDAIKAGALDYLVKGSKLFSELNVVIKRSLNQWNYI